MTDSSVLKYFPYHTVINPNFWYKLTQLKLDVDKLNEERKHIWGWFTNVKEHNLPLLEIDCASFNSEFNAPQHYLPVHGHILNKNTVEQFKDCNKFDLIDNEGFVIAEYLKTGKIIEDPSLLNSFFILSFADLKKYHYYFWFAFPTPSGVNILLESEPKNITSVFTTPQIDSLLSAYNSTNTKNKSFFVVEKDSTNKINIVALSSFVASKNTNLDELEGLYFGFSDPNLSDSHPGWPMRNFMALLLYYYPYLQGKSINVLSMRLERQSKQLSCTNSLIFRVKFPKLDVEIKDIFIKKSGVEQSSWIGWQKNDRGKFGPKLVDMSSSMDPTKLAENSVDLNLKLMKWRLLPDINLEKLKTAKFLLLGSGTLGCAVARTLLAWGVRNISLVDNGKVSYSNPVRQSLFTHEDCLNGGRPKAVAAADNLRKIFPLVNSVGYQINIPMPGHSVGESLLEDTKKNVASLTDLVSNHDVIFLLMDSRESRWLPTLLAAHFEKIVINAALGFETYLVMRHGINSNCEIKNEISIAPGLKSIPGNELGCYFCNDITAPGNSLKDRTLDQQCTVTRPGISPIAGSLAVELAISILQHPDGALAQAFYKTSTDSTAPDLEIPNEGLLGILPHSIRGFLSSFSQVLPATKRFQKCIACSTVVLQEYRKKDFEFLLKVFNSSKYLEDLTGLTELYAETESAEVWEINSSEESD